MSLNVSVIPVTDENIDAYVYMIQDMYNSEGCGICEKEGAEVFWFSPYSRCAHAKCLTMIQVAESALMQKIDDVFKKSTNPGKRNDAHIHAIQAVRAACGQDTILAYLEKKGSTALTNLLITVGIEAVNQYASKSSSKI